MLLVVAVEQPVAGVVFVLDGVLIGAGDQNYLALAGLLATAVFGRRGRIRRRVGAGLLGLWLAISAWLAARFVTLTWRARGSALAGHRRGQELIRGLAGYQIRARVGVARMTCG